MATVTEFDAFLADVEQRAFKRALYHVRQEAAALDIVQDSMLKLAQHYANKPASEWPLLFQRILGNCILDWFRAEKRFNEQFSHFSDFEGTDDNFDLLEHLDVAAQEAQTPAADQALSQRQIMQAIENALQQLPDRQRDAFILRYWDELDVAETAAVMGCGEGSVKTHCSRACNKLREILLAQGINLALEIGK